MKAFSRLLDRLTYTPARNAKLMLMRNYFRATPDPDRGFALAALTDGLPIEFPLRRVLADVATAAGLSPRDLGPDVRLERRGNFNFLFNYGPEPVTIAHDLLIGQSPVPRPASLSGRMKPHDHARCPRWCAR